MDNDHLWHPSAPPDPEVERLEQMLGGLRSTTPAPSIADLVRRMPGHDVLRWRTARFLAPALATAASVVLMIAGAWQTTGPSAGWDVASLEGRPRIGSTIIGDAGRLGVGQTLTTDASSRARLDINTLGAVTVETNSRVRLVATRADHFRLALERGTLHAVIVAPPRQFIVDTPSSRATDLGCAYMLHVDEDGTGLLSVMAGWVSFEFRGRESFVPAGASARTDPDHGPGTPRYDVTDDAFRQALDEFDGGRDASRKTGALRFVLEHASVHDAMTLWHLIPRVAPADRGAVVDALAARAPMPAAITRDAVMRLDKPALDQWWDALGLGEANWWRMWKVNGDAQALSPPPIGIKETAKLTISGPGLDRSFEIVDRSVLALSGVYGGTFIGEQTTTDPSWPRYTITFDIQTREGVKESAYGVVFTKNRWTGEGFIYLPGRGEDGYRRNIGTMIRDGQDGTWRRASDAWSRAIGTYIP